MSEKLNYLLVWEINLTSIKSFNPVNMKNKNNYINYNTLADTYMSDRIPGLNDIFINNPKQVDLILTINLN
jgi:hypothetical protein